MAAKQWLGDVIRKPCALHKESHASEDKHAPLKKLNTAFNTLCKTLKKSKIG